ncbi:MAG: biotin--[acetyl-CoA-carboxylase] ligase [Planctomycetaceae bacterium]|jgi:BirA family biotin operon repressor/biotin-[acetyl-CoA-carboxylase] ligase|nr:biotin--[acetyl-CoA-carboxylase] ligase [Planctomycetaceae bacterium]
MIDLLTIRTIEYYNCISSTNDRLKEILKSSIPPKLPCLIIAKQQTAGRGRGNKIWWSGEGALLMSLGFELAAFSLKRSDLLLFSLAVGLAVLKTIRNYLPEKNNIGLHWPNDVYVDGKKISGILIESPTPQHLVLGVGINVNNRLNEIPPEFRTEFKNKPITSFIDILDGTTDHSVLITTFLILLSNEINRITLEPLELVQEAERYCVQIGKELTIRSDHKVIRGLCLGLAPDGSLRLQTSNHIENVQTGIIGLTEGNF